MASKAAVTFDSPTLLAFDTTVLLFVHLLRGNPVMFYPVNHKKRAAVKISTGLKARQNTPHTPFATKN